MMSYRGAPNWPPVWVNAVSPVENKKIHGEIGVLTEVNFPRANSRMTSCHITMEHASEKYIGTLLFEDSALCLLIGKILRRHLGRSIKDIGDIDLSLAF